MNGYPIFGVLLGKLAARRKLDFAKVAQLADTAESELGAVLGGATPAPCCFESSARCLDVTRTTNDEAQMVSATIE